MCLAVPARILECAGDHARVEIGGVRRVANIAFIDDAKPGDYVLLHAGFAIRKWTEEDVREYQTLIAGSQSSPLQDLCNDDFEGGAAQRRPGAERHE